MPTAAFSNFDASVAVYWMQNGKAIQQGLKNAPTFSLLFGAPKETVDDNGIIDVQYANVKPIDPDTKIINFRQRFPAKMGRNVARGSAMAGPSFAQRHNIVDTLQFTTTFYIMQEILTLDQIREGKGKSWAGDQTYEQETASCMMEDYVQTVSPDLFATSTVVGAVAPQDGVLGSLRHFVSNGLGATANGSGGTDETPYANYLGYNRTVDPRFRSYYLNAAGAAFTEDLGNTVARNCQHVGGSHFVAPMNIARFTKFEQRIRTTYPHLITAMPENLMYALKGVNTITVGMVTYYVDNWVPVGTWQLILDTPSMAVGSSFNQVNLEMNKMTEREASWELSGDLKHQTMVIAPQRCGLIENLESL